MMRHHRQHQIQFSSVSNVARLCVLFCIVHTQAQSPFTQEAVDRGLIYQIQPWPQKQGHSGFGCGFADLDNDGDPDVIILGAADGRVGIFENDGTGQFIDRSITTGIPLLGMASGFTAADFDGDGDVDLYFTQLIDGNVLVLNNGGFQFTDISAFAGIQDINGASDSAAAADFDGDGWVDLYVCNYNGIFPGTENIDNKLFRNNGDGTFTDVAVQQSVNDIGYSFQAVWFDYDRDGDVDLYLSNDRGHLPPLYRSNQLWRNDNGAMTNVSIGSGADLGLFSMGVACGDFDGNGWPDLYCTNVGGYEDGFNPLFLNQGDGTFVESSAAAGVDQFVTSWSAIFFDFDNDTQKDLYVNNMFEPNMLYWNQASLQCQEVAFSLGVQANSGISFGSAVADVDGDGDLDLLVNNLSNNVELFINHNSEQRNWIRFRVVGEWPNTSAIGANVDARFGIDRQFNEVLAGGNGYKGQNELVIHMGADQVQIVDEITVNWPGGQTARILTSLPVNQTWTLYPPARLGDADGNGVVELSDFTVFSDCYQTPFAPGCEMMDFNGDSDVDAGDFVDFLATFNGVPEDCNDNGRIDLVEILDVPLLDLNGNGVLDDCETFPPGDATHDGVVNISDLLAILSDWGVCPASPDPCFSDLNNSGVVDVGDLLRVLGNWSV